MCLFINHLTVAWRRYNIIGLNNNAIIFITTASF